MGKQPKTFPPTLKEFLAQEAGERQKKYKTVLVKSFPDISQIKERVYWGLNSWTLTKSMERWIRESTSVDLGYGAQTPTEVGRDYLNFYHRKRLRATGAQAQIITQHRYAPLYIQPGLYPDCTYVDCKAAYWRILLLVGWDCDYYPGKWLCPGRAPLDFPLPDNKIARNSLVSAGLATPLRVWTGYRFIKEHRANLHLNMGLWAVVQDILHGLAWEAIKCEACYIHTDGYIVPTDRAEELMYRIAHWGLEARIKERGTAFIFGSGNWRIGERQTKGYNYSRVSPAIDRLYKVDSDHLMRKLMKFTDERYKRRG